MCPSLTMRTHSGTSPAWLCDDPDSGGGVGETAPPQGGEGASDPQLEGPRDEASNEFAGEPYGTDGVREDVRDGVHEGRVEGSCCLACCWAG